MSTSKNPKEFELWRSFGRGDEAYSVPLEACLALDIPVKQMLYYCSKWLDAGIYEYGVNLGLGWKKETDILYHSNFQRYWIPQKLHGL